MTCIYSTWRLVTVTVYLFLQNYLSQHVTGLILITQILRRPDINGYKREIQVFQSTTERKF